MRTVLKTQPMTHKHTKDKLTACCLILQRGFFQIRKKPQCLRAVQGHGKNWDARGPGKTPAQSPNDRETNVAIKGVGKWLGGETRATEAAPPHLARFLP